MTGPGINDDPVSARRGNGQVAPAVRVRRSRSQFVSAFVQEPHPGSLGPRAVVEDRLDLDPLSANEALHQ